MEQKLKYSYSIIIGDYSGDGHDKKDTVTVKTNHNKDEILKAYAKAVKKLGFALSGNKDTILQDYEDGSINNEKYLQLIEAGINFDDKNLYEFNKDEDDDAEVVPTSKGVADLFMQICKTQLKTLKYKIVEEEENLICGIGYGLFN